VKWFPFILLVSTLKVESHTVLGSVNEQTRVALFALRAPLRQHVKNRMRTQSERDREREREREGGCKRRGSGGMRGGGRWMLGRQGGESLIHSLAHRTFENQQNMLSKLCSIASSYRTSSHGS
jgi:hypothetical protein